MLVRNALRYILGPQTHSNAEAIEQASAMIRDRSMRKLESESEIELPPNSHSQRTASCPSRCLPNRLGRPADLRTGPVIISYIPFPVSCLVFFPVCISVSQI